MSTITLTIDLNTTPDEAVAEVLRILKGGAINKAVTGSAPAPAKKTVKTEPPAQVEKPAETKPESETKVSIEQVRALVQTKAKNGHREAIKEILTEMGADNVSSLPADSYNEFFNRVNAL